MPVACNWIALPDQDTLVVGLSEQPKTLDPLLATDANGQRIHQLILSSLLRWDPARGLTPDLAQRWTVQANSVELEIRPKIVFHDGKKLSKEDLQWSIERFRSLESAFTKQLENLESFNVTYDWKKGGRIQFTFKQKLAANLNHLTVIKILPRPQGTVRSSEPVLNGTGPYRFIDQSHNLIRLRKFDHYYADPGQMKHIHFKIVRDPSTRSMKLYQGELDLVQGDLPLSKVDFFRSLPDFVFHQSPSLDVTYLLINHRHPLLSKRTIRNHLRSSLSREEILTQRFKGYVEKTDQILPSLVAPWSVPPQAQAGPDPDDKKKSQRALLKSAPHKLVLSTSSNFEAAQNGAWLASQWRKSGFQVETQVTDWAHFYQKIKTGNFDLAVMKWVGIGDVDFLYQSLHSSQTPPGLNRGFYANPKFDRVVDQLRHEANAEARDQLVRQAQDIIYQDLPIIPLWSPKQVAIVNKRVKGFELEPSGSFLALLKVNKEL